MVAYPQYDTPTGILRRPIGRATGSSQITEAPEVIVEKVSGTQAAPTYVPEDQIDGPTAAACEIATSRFEDVQIAPVSKPGSGADGVADLIVNQMEVKPVVNETSPTPVEDD
ncbi:hypothetical protein GN244_ATG07383 [Phytophthora infestans]|uniref:Uncharacterized protein n=1 Tax=Phytophthora infestans TaxID=4787 RepID=A0A833SXV1_PHYIN|nr:hypothetical protein GN244_ATG07383 [Phytophthora infestans]